MKFPCLVKGFFGTHAILLDSRYLLSIEGADSGVVIKYNEKHLTPPTIFRFQTVNPDDFKIIKKAYDNMLKRFNLTIDDTFGSDEVLNLNFNITDTVLNYQSQVSPEPEPELEWHTEYEVKNTYNQFVAVDVVFEDEKRVWFRYRIAGHTPMQQPAVPVKPLNDVHSENLCSIAKSSEHYRVIKKADVTMSECLTQVVSDGPVKATLIITE